MQPRIAFRNIPSFGYTIGNCPKELLGLTQRVPLLENDVPADGPRDCVHKLDYRLVWHPNGIFGDATPEDLVSGLLPGREAVVEAVDQDVRVNESGHGRKGPLYCNPCRGPVPL